MEQVLIHASQRKEHYPHVQYTRIMIQTILDKRLKESQSDVINLRHSFTTVWLDAFWSLHNE